jgi:hypothetical protein
MPTVKPDPFVLLVLLILVESQQSRTNRPISWEAKAAICNYFFFFSILRAIISISPSSTFSPKKSVVSLLQFPDGDGPTNCSTCILIEDSSATCLQIGHVSNRDHWLLANCPSQKQLTTYQGELSRQVFHRTVHERTLAFSSI